MDWHMLQQAKAITQTYRLLVKWVAMEEEWSMERQHAAEEVLVRVEDYVRRQKVGKNE